LIKEFIKKEKLNTDFNIRIWDLPAVKKQTSKHQQQSRAHNTPIFRELTGKYCVTGFFMVRRSFSRLPTADMLSF